MTPKLRIRANAHLKQQLAGNECRLAPVRLADILGSECLISLAITEGERGVTTDEPCA